MKTAISISDGLFKAAEQAAKRLGISRSQLYQRAVREFLERQAKSQVTEDLNHVYGSSEVLPLDPVLDRMQKASLPKEDW